jgi:hypothetical protein
MTRDHLTIALGILFGVLVAHVWVTRNKPMRNVLRCGLSFTLGVVLCAYLILVLTA